MNPPIDAEIVCEDINAIPRIEWLGLRQQGLGGSDAAPALGFSPWTSPLALYFDKTDPVKDEEDNERFEWGRRNEATIADGFAARNPEWEVIVYPAMLRSRAVPFMQVNVDRLLRRGEEWAFLECKNVGVQATHEWEDGPPLHYRFQLQHTFAVLGPEFRRCFIAALIGGNRLVTYEVARDDELIADLIKREEAFWTHVTMLRPPEVDESDSTRKALAEHYSTPTLETKEVGPEILDWISQREAAKLALEIAQSRVTDAENHIKSLIGEAEAATVDGRVIATWKVVNRKEHVVRASSSRMLSIKKEKQ